MHVLFEEDGAFKVGTIMSSTESSAQIESPSGKRSKIKTGNVLLRYQEPSPNELLGGAQALADDMDSQFLWECASETEIAFADFASDYFGHTASAVEATALLLALHAAPIYFHRKGKGRFRKAPPDILAAARAGLEKKRLQALAIERMSNELLTAALPSEFTDQELLRQLLYKPDRNRLECKALEAACAASGLSVPQVLHNCGALRSAYHYHFERFLFEQFPQGSDFPEHTNATENKATPFAAADLPRAEDGVWAFSIDDASTTEIDDAFSVQFLPAGLGFRVGIHIAAPGVGVSVDSALGQIARQRLSTVYMPGNKITMLPPAVIEQFTLSAGRTCPAISLYLTVAPDFSITAYSSRLEQVPIAANLRLHEIEPLFNHSSLAAGLAHLPAELPFRAEFEVLWQLACASEARRGKSSTTGFDDYNFTVDGDLADPDNCNITIDQRQRGSPLDKVVSELMIITNSTWGAWLAENKIPAIYRAQSAGKVRMTTSPLPHEGLGVAQYAWSSSPLRRYIDLLNQWQLIACINQETPHFSAKSDTLFAALRDFELTYAAYGEFQRNMERYWCLRWLRQEKIDSISATVRREDLCKIDHLPLVLRISSLPALVPGQRIRLSIASLDFLSLDLDLRYQETLSDPVAAELSESEN